MVKARTIGPFLLLEPLAAGARSQVWRARDSRSGLQCGESDEPTKGTFDDSTSARNSRMKHSVSWTVKPQQR
jgi:hypothetical protein